MNEAKRERLLQFVEETVGQSIEHLSDDGGQPIPVWGDHLSCNLVHLAFVVSAIRAAGIDYDEIKQYVTELVPELIPLLKMAYSVESPISVETEATN